MKNTINIIDEFLEVSPEEFRFIRQTTGITYKKLSKSAGKLSRSTSFNWEKQERMKQYQVQILRKLISPELWSITRRLWFMVNTKKQKQTSNIHNSQIRKVRK